MDLISKFYNSESDTERELKGSNNNEIIKDETLQKSELKDNVENNNISKIEKESTTLNIPNNENKETNEQEEKLNVSSNLIQLKTEILNNIDKKLKTIDCAPEIDIDDLLKEQEIKKYEKFNSNFFVPLKPNHLTGYINYHTMNDFNFKEQYYNFNAYGFALDPTDFSGNKIIGDKKAFENENTPKTVYDNLGKVQRDSRKKLKMKRMKYGDPGTGEFMGPWAIYEGEEIFKNMSGDLTEEQKEMLKQIEEKRQKKIDEEKAQESNILNVLFNIYII